MFSVVRHKEAERHWKESSPYAFFTARWPVTFRMSNGRGCAEERGRYLEGTMVDTALLGQGMVRKGREKPGGMVPCKRRKVAGSQTAEGEREKRKGHRTFLYLATNTFELKY